MKNQSIKHTTRGGQVILHNLRMIGQILQKTAWWLLPVGILAVVGWFYLSTDKVNRLIGQQWLSAEFHLFFNNSHFRQIFVFPSGQKMTVTVGQIISAPFVKQAILELQNAVQRSLEVGLVVWVISVIGVLIWLRKRGEAYTTNKPIKGDQLGSVEDIKKIIRAQNMISDLIFGTEQLPLPKRVEVPTFINTWYHRNRKIHGH